MNSNKNKKVEKFDSGYAWWSVYIENVNFVPDHLSVRLLFFHAMIHPRVLIYFFCFSLQIMLSDASRSLYTALNRRVYFNQATVVVPSNWRDAKCKIQIHAPRSGSSYGVRSSSLSNYPATDRNILNIFFHSWACHTLLSWHCLSHFWQCQSNFIVFYASLSFCHSNFFWGHQNNTMTS